MSKRTKKQPPTQTQTDQNRNFVTNLCHSLRKPTTDKADGHMVLEDGDSFRRGRKELSQFEETCNTGSPQEDEWNYWATFP